MDRKSHLSRKDRFDLPKGFCFPEKSMRWVWSYWKKIRHIKEMYPSIDGFMNNYYKGNDLILEGPGILLRVTNIHEKWYGTIHALVFSKEVFGVISELNQLVLDVMDHYGFVRLEAYVPNPERGVNRLLEKVGFVKEGTLRKGGRKSKIIHDENVYSIVR